MNPLTTVLFLSGAVLPLLVLAGIYNAASWTWKTRPGVPLLLGITTLAIAFTAHLWLTSTAADIKDFIDHAPKTITKDALQIFLATSRTNESLAKLVELFTIPLAVSIIAAALLAKADLEFEFTLMRYNERAERIGRLEDRYDAASRKFEQSLESGLRGHALMIEREALRAIREQMIDERREFRKEFRSLIDSHVINLIKRREKKI